MKKQLLYIVILISSLFFTACKESDNPIESPTLLFKSGFEQGVVVEEPYNDGGGTWEQDVQGSDSSDFTWPIKFWDTSGVFQVLVDSSLDSKEYIKNEIVPTTGHSGKTTMVMRSTIYKAAQGWTQDPYIIMDAKESGDLYVSYWIKMPENLQDVLGDGTKDDGWCTFFEWKTSGDYRIAAYIYLEEDGKPYWYVHGDNVANSAIEMPYHEYWNIENHTYPVPEGEWFMVEFFWHRSINSDGRFWWAVDGNIIADYHGSNKIKEPIDRIMLFTVYSGKYPLSQEVDDIEIWDGFPCGVGKSCYKE